MPMVRPAELWQESGRYDAYAKEVLAELYGLGLTWVGRPIPATSGALHEWLGDDLVVVFAYLDAPQAPFTYGGERLGDLIACVHQQTEQIASPLVREAFAPSYGDKLWQAFLNEAAAILLREMEHRQNAA